MNRPDGGRPWLVQEADFAVGEPGRRPQDSLLYRNRLLTRAAPIRAATVRERYAATAQYHTVADLVRAAARVLLEDGYQIEVLA